MRSLLSQNSRRLTSTTPPSRLRRLSQHGTPTCSTALSPVTRANDAVHLVSTAQSLAFFSTTSSAESYPDHFHARVELDGSLPLSMSVNQLLAIPVGRVHPLDFYNKFPNIMRACCKSQRMDQAQLLLERMLQEKRESGRIVPAKAFEIIIFGWALNAKKEPKHAIKNMMEILNLMEQEYDYDYQHALESEEGDSCQPRTETYNTVLRGMAEAATFLPTAARDAESLLQTMESIHERKVGRPSQVIAVIHTSLLRMAMCGDMTRETWRKQYWTE